jgi:hypothetical protein
MEVCQSWSQLKSVIASKLLVVQYCESDGGYRVWCQEGDVLYGCFISKEDEKSDDQIDFETNYKDGANKPIAPKTADGKTYVRAESRPLNMTTCFTGRGDSATVVGGGTMLMWNAATDTDFVAVDSNFKRKVIDFGFRDEVCLKEGSIYFFETSWYGELQLWSYLPAAYSPTGHDLFMDNFVVSLFFSGDCPMGDELNTECASGEIPPYIRHQIWITLPTEDVKSRGYVNLEVYRSKTV